MTVVVAELGINHGGSFDVAVQMIRSAAIIGCDAAKVQSFKATDFLRRDDPDFALVQSCEIWKYLPQLAKVAHDCKLQFGVTPQVESGVCVAVEAGADYLKVASECILQHGLIKTCLATGLPTWVSTGMASEAEVEAVPEQAALMLCTSLYPCPPEQAHLARFSRWPGQPGLRIPRRWRGYSDHTEGIEAAVIAAYEGVEMIEKHFTLDKDAEGPDHSFSADPGEMAALVKAVRKTQTMRGSSQINPPPQRNLILEGQLRT